MPQVCSCWDASRTDPENGMAGPLIFLIAGEPSGDTLGARLMAGLKDETRGDVRFVGVGGPEMEAQGLRSLFPMSDLAIMGLFEVFPRLRHVIRRLKETVETICSTRPDLVIMIDAQGFSYRIARRLQPAPCPVIHYVAPTVWAWKPWRARHVARVVDRLLLLFPFEKPHWDAVDQDAVFVGHPIAETSVNDEDVQVWRREARTDGDGPVLVLLPGSRQSEVRRHLPLFRETMALLSDKRPHLSLLLPTVANVAQAVRDEVADWPWPATVVEGSGDTRRAAMAAGDLALAVSGTVALDLAAAGTPHVIAFRANVMTVAIIRHMLKVKYASLVNLIADAPVTPELLQEYCTPQSLCHALERILFDPDVAAGQCKAMADVMAQLGSREDPPSRRAARAALACIRPSSG